MNRRFNPGYILLSSYVVEDIRTRLLFAEALGQALYRHFNSKIPEQYLETKEIKIETSFRHDLKELVIITEKDRNQMPRTTVVFREELGR